MKVNMKINDQTWTNLDMEEDKVINIIHSNIEDLLTRPYDKVKIILEATE